MESVIRAGLELIDEGSEASVSKISNRLYFSRTAIQAKVISADALKAALWIGLLGSLISLGGFKKLFDSGVIQTAPVVKAWVTMFPHRFRFLIGNDPPMYLVSQAEACFLRFILLLLISDSKYELTPDDEIHLQSLAEKMLKNSPLLYPHQNWRYEDGVITLPFPWRLQDSDPLARGDASDWETVLRWAQIEFDHHTLLAGRVDLRSSRPG